MTRQEILQLDSKQLNRAIADKLGCWYTGSKWWFPDLDTGYLACWDTLPLWDSDIAQAWKLEEMLDYNQRELYTQALTWIVNRLLCRNQRWELIHATPDYRARAWLIVKSEEKLL